MIRRTKRNIWFAFARAYYIHTIHSEVKKKIRIIRLSVYLSNRIINTMLGIVYALYIRKKREHAFTAHLYYEYLTYNTLYCII